MPRRSVSSKMPCQNLKINPQKSKIIINGHNQIHLHCWAHRCYVRRESNQKCCHFKGTNFIAMWTTWFIENHFVSHHRHFCNKSKSKLEINFVRTYPWYHNRSKMCHLEECSPRGSFFGRPIQAATKRIHNLMFKFWALIETVLKEKTSNDRHSVIIILSYYKQTT